MRALSLLLAVAATALLIAAPFVVARQMSPATHAILPVLLLGISVAFVHGLGYVPRLFFFRALATPLIAWSLILGSAAMLMMR
ncbi:hypothetical protein GCM10011611_57500 [Aliidongia dinghuensis]|uniref:Cyd operon protein YbgE n=1 Tax=Aliidongia dinghuensis TaxID=1867774 RepID=A0A8J2Z092_9PROT|nr:cyd operon YbgE family protein [Aliidongia dinghuensis]GGF43563.1 hypothetical protein GCM10011611_57500 [Aliidongia dinghuensis]